MTSSHKDHVQEVIDFCAFGPAFWSLDWPVVERKFGHPLPSDYKRLCDAVPPGRFSDFFWLLHPLGSCGASLVSEEPALRDVFKELMEIESDDEYWVEEEWINPATLFPCLQTDNGDVGYWASSDSDNPDEWTVVINWVRSPDWGITELTLSGLLYRHIAEGAYPFNVLIPDMPARELVSRRANEVGESAGFCAFDF